MIKGIYKILFLIISISFFISAAEMDLGNTHNTFFDDYDTYLKEDNLSVDYTLSSFVEKDICFVSRGYFAHCLNTRVDRLLKTSYNPQLTYRTSRLFLRNSVWRV